MGAVRRQRPPAAPVPVAACWLLLAVLCRAEGWDDVEVRPPLLAAAGNGGDEEASPRRAQAEIQCPMRGVIFNFAIADLPFGWTQFYEAPYSAATNVGMMRPRTGECLLWGAGRQFGATAPTHLSIAAFGDRRMIENDMPPEPGLLMVNNVSWYTYYGKSAGFSQKGDVIADPGDKGLFDCIGRMSWLLNGEGGYRAGCATDLGNAADWRKFVFFGPRGVFCDVSVCPIGKILKTDGLPNYCAGAICTEEECCMPARTCSADVCAIGFLLKEVPPQFCALSLCQEDECCVQAPSCTASVCGVGYHLKPKDTLPPRGQPRNGCASYRCTRDECCDASPRCPPETCPLGQTLTTVDPAPYCTSFDCTPWDCCTGAGVCLPAVCNEPGYKVRMLNYTVYCDRPTCVQWECCDYLPPAVKLSGLWFVDEDIRAHQMGGLLTWVEPPVSTVPNVTRVKVFASNATFRVPIFEGSSSLRVVEVPRGTMYLDTLEVFSGNVGGWMKEPAIFKVVDSRLMPGEVLFDDLDLDSGQIGGYISWEAEDSNSSDFMLGSCQNSVNLRVRGGYGNMSHGVKPAFFINDKEVLVNLSIPYGSITVAELTDDMASIHWGVVFNTGADPDDAVNLENHLIGNVTRGAKLMLATWGHAHRFLNLTRLAMFFEATELRWVGARDSWAFIGAKRWPGPTFREQWVHESHQVPAVVEVRCPVTRHSVLVTNGGQTIDLGPLPPGQLSALLPAETQIFEKVGVRLLLATPRYEFAPPPLVLEDHEFRFDAVTYVEDDPGAIQDMGGLVSWTPAGAAQQAKMVRIYLATSPTGQDLRLLAEVPISVKSLRIPRGYTRGNVTHMLFYAVSELGEQSRPFVQQLSDLNPPVGGTLVASVVITAMILQFSKILEALERAAKAVDSKDISDVPFRGKFLDSEGNFLKITGPPPFGAIPWRGPVSQLLGPCGVSHHDKTVKMVFKTAQQQKRLPCLRRARLKTKAVMITSCINAWDNDEFVVKKVSNNVVKVFGKSGEISEYRRKPKFWYKIIRDSKIFSRKAIKMYAPMVALLGIAFLIAYSGALILAVAMLMVVAVGAALVFMASRMACTKDLVRIVEALPPKAIRRKFWKGVENLVGVLPAAPAFLASTEVGYATGVICLSGSFLRSRKALAAAVILEGLGGLAVMAYIFYARMGDSNQSDENVGKNTAVTLGAILTLTKALDTQIENQERLHDNQPLKTDALMQAAEDAHSLSGVGVWSAVALESFTQGCCEVRHKQRLPAAMKAAASGVALRAKVMLSTFIEEVHHGSSRWPKSPSQLAYAVGRAIDAASRDLHLKELQLCRSNNQRQEIYKILEVALEELEDALRQLLNGPLAGKPVNRYRSTAKELAGALAEVATEFKRVECTVGSSDIAGRRARAQVLGHYAALLTTTAVYVQDEVSTGELTAVDLRLLFVKVDQMQKQAAQAVSVMEGVPSDWEEVQEAAGNLQALRELLCEIVELLQDVAVAPLPSPDKRRLLGLVGQVIELAEALASFSEANMLTADQLHPEVQAQAMQDIQERTLGRLGRSSTLAFLDETATALSTSRIAVGLVQVATEELRASTDKVTLVVDAMVQARKAGYRTLMSVAKAREFLQGLSAQQLQKLQREAIEYTLGAPVQALVNLQEVSVDSAKLTHKALLDDLQKVSSQLDSRVDLAPAAPRKSRLKAALGRLKRSRVAPADDDDDDDDDDMYPSSLTKLETLPELRETALGDADAPAPLALGGRPK